MVHRLDRSGEQRAKEKADGGHQCLKAAKPQSAGGTGFRCCFLHRQAFAYGHREGIHADTNRQQKQFPNAHKKTPVHFKGTEASQEATDTQSLVI